MAGASRRMLCGERICMTFAGVRRANVRGRLGGACRHQGARRSVRAGRSHVRPGDSPLADRRKFSTTVDNSAR